MAISSASLSLHLVPRTTSSRSSLGSSNSVFFNNDSGLFVKKSICVTVNRSAAQKGLECNCLFGLGVAELVVIAGVAALVFGPKKLPEIGRSVGKTIKGFQQAAKEFETELKKAPEESTESPPDQPVVVSEGKNAGEKRGHEESGAKERA
ncbi:sec-independent protein translocase protein TATA, chloroplastic-like [Aristolochia californica]|uniref:sec-independent protein translocase protein TATA, chloroplastic-like n=1 Tax=Aristolochia californica TaxID=171875 RepID=UPI0035DCF599